jgi:hypothetical protein
MLNTLKLLVHRFLPKSEIEHIESSQNVSTDNDHKTISAPSPLDGEISESNNFDIHVIRQRVNSELHSIDKSARQRDRALMDKWFNRGDPTNSGSFQLAELQRRLEEISQGEHEVIEALPAQEDILMAFSKPEVDLFEEEKITLSGVFMRVNPNEDFDEQYSMPLIPMFSSNEHIETTKQVIMLDEHESLHEEFNLDFKVEETHSVPALETLIEEISFDEIAIEETLQELISDSMPITIPIPVPAFVPCPAPEAEAQERHMSKIDPSKLFEEWTSEISFDPEDMQAASAFSANMTVSLSASPLPACVVISEQVSFEPIKTEVVSSTDKAVNEVTTEAAMTAAAKPEVKLVAKHSDAYWSESDRLTRFGRRRTSASCSSTRVRALTQIA